MCEMSVKLLMDLLVGCLHYFQVIVFDVFLECFLNDNFTPVGPIFMIWPTNPQASHTL